MSRSALAWLASACLIAYTAIVYLGLGVSQNETSPALWQPSGFLRDTELIGALRESHWWGVALLSAIPAIGFVVCVSGLRSALATGVAGCALVTSALIAFYSLSNALRIWEFFHWRGSLVIGLTGLGVGLALATPWLAAAWLRLGTLAKTVTYGPVFVAAVSLIRNATGTDESLFFNLSPWPAIPVLGLEIGAYTLAGLWLGLAIGLAIVRAAPGATGAQSLGFCAGAVIPIVWFTSRFSYTDVGILGVMLCISATAMLLAQSIGEPAAVGRRAVACGVAAALVTLPLVTGRALADGDHTVTRHVRAAILIEALARHYAEHRDYPEDLDALIAAGYLDAIPSPRIGFEIYYALGWLDPIGFHYQNLGSSYVLEFVSTDWVMCTYNPPWPEGDADSDSDDGTGEAWSCPNDRPELW